MSQNVIDLAVTQFSTNLEMKVQQMTSKIRGRVAEGTHVGKQASPVQYLAPIKVQTPAARFGPMPRVDASFERRWVFPKDGDLPQLIDSYDLLRTISDPTSQYSSNAAAAVGREWDDRLIAASVADASLGTDVNGLSTETFDSSTYGVAVNFGGTTTGLTFDKLVELNRKFRHYAEDGNPDNDERTILIGSQQEADILSDPKATSKEYGGLPILQNGSINGVRWMGFTFLVIERLSVASNVRTCIAFMKSGLYLGIWKEMSASASKRNDLSGEPFQLYVGMSSGATRLQKGKLMTVACSDTSGASIVP